MPPVIGKSKLKSTIALLNKAARLLDGFKEEFAEDVFMALKKIIRPRPATTRKSRTGSIGDSEIEYYDRFVGDSGMH